VTEPSVAAAACGFSGPGAGRFRDDRRGRGGRPRPRRCGPPPRPCTARQLPRLRSGCSARRPELAVLGLRTRRGRPGELISGDRRAVVRGANQLTSIRPAAAEASPSPVGRGPAAGWPGYWAARCSAASCWRRLGRSGGRWRGLAGDRSTGGAAGGTGGAPAGRRADRSGGPWVVAVAADGHGLAAVLVVDRGDGARHPRPRRWSCPRSCRCRPGRPHPWTPAAVRCSTRATSAVRRP